MWPGRHNQRLLISLACAAAIALVTGSVLAGAPASEPAVKMSRGGICHERGTVHYQQTIYFERFDSMQACFAAGGRRMGDKPQPYIYRGTHPSRIYALLVILGIIAALAIIVGVGVPWWQRRRLKLVRMEEDRARRYWEGHKLEPKNPRK